MQWKQDPSYSIRPNVQITAKLAMNEIILYDPNVSGIGAWTGSSSKLQWKIWKYCKYMSHPSVQDAILPVHFLSQKYYWIISLMCLHLRYALTSNLNVKPVHYTWNSIKLQIKILLVTVWRQPQNNFCQFGNMMISALLHGTWYDSS